MYTSLVYIYLPCIYFYIPISYTLDDDDIASVWGCGGETLWCSCSAPAYPIYVEYICISIIYIQIYLSYIFKCILDVDDDVASVGGHFGAAAVRRLIQGLPR